MSRLANLLGAQAVAIADRIRHTGADRGMAASEHAALVTMFTHPDRPVSWLGEVLGLTSSGVTRLLDRVVEAGWAIRTPGADARQRRLHLTAAGRERAATLLRDRQQLLTEVVGVLSEDDRAELERLLGLLVGGLTASPMPALQMCRLCDRAACFSGAKACPLAHTVAAEALDV